MSATCTYNSKSAACSACHSGALGTEHGRADLGALGLRFDTCEKCHNDSATVADVVTSSWTNKNTTSACCDCHTSDDGTAAATRTPTWRNHATGTTVTGCTGDGRRLPRHGRGAEPHRRPRAGCALTRACHSPSVYNPGAKTCTNDSCHPAATYNTTTYAHNAVNGTDADAHRLGRQHEHDRVRRHRCHERDLRDLPLRQAQDGAQLQRRLRHRVALVDERVHRLPQRHEPDQRRGARDRRHVQRLLPERRLPQHHPAGPRRRRH